MTKILVAEDDPLMVDLYSKALRLYGYNVEMAFNGEDALQKLLAMAEKPTLILSDIMMPKMNGLELLKRLKAEPTLKNIPVVMLTNLAGEQDAQQALLLGAVTYLVKSQYEPKEVVEKLKEIVGGYTRDAAIPEVTVELKDSTHPDNRPPAP